MPTFSSKERTKGQNPGNRPETPIHFTKSSVLPVTKHHLPLLERWLEYPRVRPSGTPRAPHVAWRLPGVVKSKPVFLHAAAGKPWLWLGGGAYWSQSNFFSWHRRLLQELSPYVYEARQYRAELDTDSGWMYRRTGTGTILRLLGLGHFAMRGFPLAVAATVVSTAKKLLQPVQNQPPEPASIGGRDRQ